MEDENMQDIELLQKKQTELENKVKTDIDSLKNIKDVNEAIKMAKHITHHAYQIFVIQNTKIDRNKNKDYNQEQKDKQQAFINLSKCYYWTRQALNNLPKDGASKSQLKKIDKLNDEIKNAENKVDEYGGIISAGDADAMYFENTQMDVKLPKSIDKSKINTKESKLKNFRVGELSPWKEFKKRLKKGQEKRKNIKKQNKSASR